MMLKVYFIGNLIQNIHLVKNHNNLVGWEKLTAKFKVLERKYLLRFVSKDHQRYLSNIMEYMFSFTSTTFGKYLIEIKSFSDLIISNHLSEKSLSNRLLILMSNKMLSG